MYSEFNSDDKNFQGNDKPEDFPQHESLNNLNNSGIENNSHNISEIHEVTEIRDAHDFEDYRGYGRENSQKVYDIYATDAMRSSVEKPKRKNGFKTIAIVLAIVLFGTATGVGGYWLNSLLANDGAIVANSDKNDVDNRKKTDSHPALSDMQTSNSVENSNKASTYIGKNDKGVYENLADLIEDVSSSVVFVSNYASDKGEEKSLQGTGSGIVISADGYIITNQHVVNGAKKVKVTIDSGKATEKIYDAKMIGTDKDTDLAVLKIEAKDLKVAVLGDSDTLRVGDNVVAIGNPSGLVGTATQGIISGLNRKSSDDSRTLPSIQTDAAVNFGNSGGALFDMGGRVIGVVNAKIVDTGYDNLGFAITINQAKPIIDDLLANGYVSGRPVLGITFLQISKQVAEMQGRDAGLYVTEINPDLPVGKSGLKLADTITSIDGKDVSSLTDVQSILNNKKPGDKVKIKVIRYDTLGDKKDLELEIQLGEKIN